jgi:glucuronate isomerase
MKAFLDKDFLLETDTAKELFRAAKDEPIFDYHCHLIPQQIAENKQFANLAEIWLGGDHYKWRMLRAAGVPEALVTGKGDPYEKFLAWARVVPRLIGNPLYHWTHLELQRYFDISEPLNEKSAKAIWDACNAKLATPDLSVKGIFAKFKVYAVGTTDDPADDLAYHKQITAGTAPIGKIATKVIPSFRPDKAINIDMPGFAEYITKLGAATGVKIANVDDVVIALGRRLLFFASLGCRASDHGLEYVPFVKASYATINDAFKAALAGFMPAKEAADAYKTKVLAALAALYRKHNIAMQLHLAVIRNMNTRVVSVIGPETGFDGVHDLAIGANLAGFLNYVEATQGGLPKTILYSLNREHYYTLATIMGGFQGEGVFGKMQLGSAWWFTDHRDGMEEQMKVLANVGLLPAFIGMLTDSRSFLSYPRHEYFRRILCNILGTWVENGEYPADIPALSKIVRDISFGNAQRYFA